MNTENINIEYVTTDVNENITLTLPKNDYFAILRINTNQVLPEWRNQLCEQIVHSRPIVQNE